MNVIRRLRRFLNRDPFLDPDLRHMRFLHERAVGHALRTAPPISAGSRKPTRVCPRCQGHGRIARDNRKARTQRPITAES